MKKTNTKNTVALTASIVTGLSVAERGLGFLYRIVLSRCIGAEELGLYQVALSLFSLFLTIGTGGIPITVSRMISKSKAENRPLDEQRAVSAGLTLSLLLTLPVCLLLIPFGDRLGFLFTDERAFPVFRILLVGLCFSSLYAVFRGSFWGNKQFLLPALLELAEESVMVIAGVLLLRNPFSSGAERAAWAVILSYLFSFTAAVLCFFFRGGKLSPPQNALKPLFNATLPITSVRASSSLVNSAVAVLLPVMLVRSGLDSSSALTLFGVVSGMVLPILFISSTIIGSISLVLVPELSEDFYRKNFTRLKQNIGRGLRFAFLLACALIPFFFTLGKDLGMLAFSNAKSGEMIALSAPILLPMSLTMISTSMLNSIGFEKQSFLFYFVGAAAMLLCVLTLPAVCGIYAYLIGLGLSFLLTALCNLIFLRKQFAVLQKRREQVHVQRYFTPILFILPITLFGKITDGILSRFLGELLSLGCSALLMAGLTFLLYLLSGVFTLSNIKCLFIHKRKNGNT
jgi:stage V sporulation protein B